MSNKTAVITGASTGIGKKISKLFLEKGYNLVINSVNASNLQKTFDELGKPENIRMVPGDISRKNVSEEVVKTAVDTFGRIDVLVNNAGVFAPKPFLEVEEEDLEKYLAVNLKGTYFTSQAAIGKMLENGGGSIINIGTVLVDHAIGGFPASAPISSKGGIHALTKQLAAEFGKDNIRINVIAPGIIRTPLLEKNGITNADDLSGLHLLNKVGEVSDIAHTALFLAESNFITGEVVNVDGGHVAGHHFG